MQFSFIDFLIGLTLVNMVPHLTLGIWKGRMFSGLGFGNTQNILYGLINLAISVALMVYQYGMDGLLSNSLYLGGLFVILCYILLGPIFYKQFHARFYAEK